MMNLIQLNALNIIRLLQVSTFLDIAKSNHISLPKTAELLQFFPVKLCF